jgi:HEAT repeat protein
MDDLVKLLGDSDPQCQGDAAMAIAAMGPAAAAAVPTLQKLLDSEGVAREAAPGLQYAAAYALGQLGAASAPALAKLREFAASPDQMLATVASWAAIKIAPEDTSLFESAVPLFRQALRSDSETARLEAACILGDIGRQADSAIPILELVAEEDPSRTVRSAAAEALAKIKGK